MEHRVKRFNISLIRVPVKKKGQEFEKLITENSFLKTHTDPQTREPSKYQERYVKAP